MQKISDHKTACTCVFCTAKCPECRSHDVGVVFSTSYKGSHYADDELRFTNVGDTVQLTCHRCKVVIDSSDPRDSQGNSIKALQEAIHNVFVDDVYRVYIDKDYNITCTAYRYKSDDDGAQL